MKCWQEDDGERVELFDAIEEEFGPELRWALECGRFKLTPKRRSAVRRVKRKTKRMATRKVQRIPNGPARKGPEYAKFEINPSQVHLELRMRRPIRKSSLLMAATVILTNAATAVAVRLAGA